MRRYTEEQKSTVILDSEWYRASVLANDIEEVYDYIDTLLEMIDPENSIDAAKLRCVQGTLEFLMNGCNFVDIKNATLQKGGLR